MKVKEHFPDEATMRAHLTKEFPEYFSRVKHAVGNLEAAYQWAVWRGVVAGVVLIVVFVVFLFLMEADLRSGLFGLISFCLILVCIVAVKFVIDAMNMSMRFSKQLDVEVFRQVLDLFGLEGKVLTEDAIDPRRPSSLLRKHSHWFPVSAPSVSQRLTASELITEPHNRVVTDDALVSLMDGRLEVWELDVEHVTQQGKSRHVKELFQGYFVSFVLPKTLLGKTFVSTEGDKRGFGHRSFFTDMLGVGPSSTELEWNDFENKLHVATTDGVEARYVLTPDFMQDLYQWWHDKQQHIRLSFIGNRFYLLFPDKRIRIGRTIRSLKEEEVRAYFESIALPLLHVLHLVQDVDEQFRYYETLKQQGASNS
jgi:hypothetical protein